jgi:hypothetical protein
LVSSTLKETLLLQAFEDIIAPMPLHVRHRGILVVAVHGHSLRVSAELSVSGRGDGSATVTLCAALLECQKLLGTESLVVDLRGSLDEILEMGSEQEVSQEDKFTVVLILYVDDTPAVLASSNLLAINDD